MYSTDEYARKFATQILAGISRTKLHSAAEAWRVRAAALENDPLIDAFRTIDQELKAASDRHTGLPFGLGDKESILTATAEVLGLRDRTLIAHIVRSTVNDQLVDLTNYISQLLQAIENNPLWQEDDGRR